MVELARKLYPHKQPWFDEYLRDDNEPNNLMLFGNDAEHRKYHELMRMEMVINA